MNKKTKFFIAILLPVILLISGAFAVFAYDGQQSFSKPCEKKGDNGACYFSYFGPPNLSQAYKLNVKAHLEGHGGFGRAGGRGSIVGCLSESGAANTGACKNLFPEEKVGDGNRNVDATLSLDPFANYDLAYKYAWVRVFADDATWDPLTVTVYGRKVEITSPKDDIIVNTGKSFTVNWNVAHGWNTVFMYDDQIMTCDTGSGYEVVGPGGQGKSGSTTCTARSTPGQGEIIVTSNGPTSTGYTPIQKTIIVTVTSLTGCLSTKGNSCTSAANSCGQKNTGIIECDGKCVVAGSDVDANVPPNVLVVAPPDSQCTGGPVNGACSTTHYNCSAGTTANNVDGSTSWTWACNGSGGGTNATCSENKSIDPVCTDPAATNNGGPLPCVFTSTPATGVLDAANCDIVGGWAWDPDLPDEPNQVKIYKDGVQYGGPIDANNKRDDLPGNKFHSFTISTPAEWKDGADHQITAKATDLNGSVDQELQGTPKTLNCPAINLCTDPAAINNGGPMPCTYLPPPSDLNLECPLPGTTVTASWTPPAFWNTFYLRANPGANNGLWPSAVIQDNVVSDIATSSFPSVPGQTYYVWAHTRSPANGAWSTEISGNVTCASSGMYGSLTPKTTSCFISAGQGTCPIDFSWSVFNPVALGGSIVTNPSGSTVGTGDSRVDFPLTVKHGGEAFSLKNNNVTLATSSVGAYCGPGTTWSDPICVGSLIMSGTLTPARPSCIIPIGQKSCPINLSWNTVNPIGTSSVTSPTRDDGTLGTTTVAPNLNSGGPTPFVIPYNGRTFFLYNSGVSLHNPPSGLRVFSNCDLGAGAFWDGTKCVMSVTNGICGAIHNSCISGVSANPGSNSTAYTWQCNSPNGGTNRSCSEFKPCGNGFTNPPICDGSGACGATHNSCISGVSANPGSNSTSYTWNCNGANGVNRSCSEFKPCDNPIYTNPPICDGSSLCPTGTVVLSSYIINAGQSITATAPPGFTGGTFVSNNPSVANVSGNTITAVSPGVAVIYGSGWTYSNGAVCSLYGSATSSCPVGYTGTYPACDGNGSGTTCPADGLYGTYPNCYGDPGTVLTVRRTPIFIEN